MNKKNSQNAPFGALTPFDSHMVFEGLFWLSSPLLTDVSVFTVDNVIVFTVKVKGEYETNARYRS